MKFPTHARFIFTIPLTLLTGCTCAPMVDIGGSFFPSWMLCVSLSIVFAFALRGFLRYRGLETELGTLAIFYPGLVLLLSCVLWLTLFR